MSAAGRRSGGARGQFGEDQDRAGMEAEVCRTGCDCGQRVGVASAAVCVISGEMLGKGWLVGGQFWLVRGAGVQGDLLDSEHVSPSTPGAGEDPAADDRLSVSRRLSADVWQAGAGTVEPVRSGSAAESIEHGAERDDWRRQLGVGGGGWGDWSAVSAYDQLGADSDAVPVTEVEHHSRGDGDGVDSARGRRLGGDEEGGADGA